MSQLDLIATSTFGLEAVVVRELEALGYEGKVVQPGRIGFRAEPSAIARANLWLRSSDRLLLRLGTFGAQDFGTLFDQTFALPWELPRERPSGCSAPAGRSGGGVVGERAGELIRQLSFLEAPLRWPYVDKELPVAFRAGQR